MISRIPWVTGVDQIILDWLHEHDVVITPKLLYDNFERDLTDPELPSYSQIKRRIVTLRTAGLVEHYGDRGKYQLSDLGRRLMEDELEEDERLELATMSQAELEGEA